MTVNYSQTPINNQGFDLEEHDISAHGRDIGIVYSQMSHDFDHSSIFQFDMFMNEFNIDLDTKEITQNYEYLDVEQWHNHSFKGYTLSEADLVHSFCNKQNDSIKLKGDFGKDSFKILRVDISKWDNDTTGNCAPENEIDDLINNVTLFVLLGDSYISFETGKAEIIDNTKVVDEYFTTMFTKNLDILVRKNDFSYTDSLILNSESEGTFYSFSEERRLLSNNLHDTSPLIRIYIYMDYRTDRYEMSLYTLWDMIGVVGGVYEVLQITCSIFMGIYTQKLMSVDLVNSYIK